MQREQTCLWLLGVRRAGAEVSRACCGPAPVLGIRDFPEGRLELAQGTDGQGGEGRAVRAGHLKDLACSELQGLP